MCQGWVINPHLLLKPLDQIDVFSHYNPHAVPAINPSVREKD